MTDTLTPLDATFLELEQVDDSAHMHIGGALVFDPRPDGSTPTLQELCAHIEGRLRALPRYGCKLSQPHTGGLSWPEWVEDPGFDITKQIHHATLPGPGGEVELREWLGDYWSHRLDRTRPLWDAVLLDGLEHGRWAIATKTHHSLVDGVGSVDISYALLDATPEPPAQDEQPQRPQAHALHGDGDRSRRAQLSGAIRWAPEQALRAARAGAGIVVHPHTAVEMLDKSRATVTELIRDELIPAPQSSLNYPFGKSRKFAVVRVPLADVRKIRSGLGGTINDVVLASVTGGLHRVLRARGDALPDAGLRAMVPMNIRQHSEHGELGNKITSLFVHLPVSGTTAGERLKMVVAEAKSRKSGSQAAGTAAIISLAGLAPPALHATIARSLYATRLFNITVTNVPGPQITLYGAGARLREILPLVPLAAEHSVGVAIFSYDGMLFYGINAADDVSDLELLEDGIAEEIDDLLELARAR